MLRASYSFSKVSASASRGAVSLDLTSANIVASYLLLAESLNRFFADSMSVAELATFSVTKTETDALDVIELTAFSVGKGVTDTVGVTEVISRTIEFSRTFADTASVTEIHSINFDTSEADELSVFDAPSVTPELNKDDSLSMAESLTRVVAYSRSFSDAFALDDFASIGDLSKDTTIDKGNVLGVTESLAFAAQKAVLDTLLMQEALSITLTPASFSEFNGAVFNAFVFNE